MRHGVFSALAMALMAMPVTAAQLTDFLPMQDGAASCWQRLYSAAHLASHPQQKVSKISFGLSYRGDTADYPGFYWFGASVSTRDGVSGRTSGPCQELDGDVVCGVECDGGNVVLSRGADGNLLIDLEKYGYLRFESECAGGSEEASFHLESGRDDKLFLLYPSAIEACTGLAEY